MGVTGEVVFAIADSECIDNVNMGFLPGKIIKRGDNIALGRKAPKDRWLYISKFSGEDGFLDKLEKLLSLLAEKEHDIERLMDQYEEVSINIYIRSELAEIGFTLPQNIIQKLAFIKCPVNFEILSFGMAPNR